MTLSKSHYTLTLQRLSYLHSQTGGLFLGALTADSHKNAIFLDACLRGMLLCLLTFDNPGEEFRSSTYTTSGIAQIFKRHQLIDNHDDVYFRNMSVFRCSSEGTQKEAAGLRVQIRQPLLFLDIRCDFTFVIDPGEDFFLADFLRSIDDECVVAGTVGIFLNASVLHFDFVLE